MTSVTYATLQLTTRYAIGALPTWPLGYDQFYINSSLWRTVWRHDAPTFIAYYPVSLPPPTHRARTPSNPLSRLGVLDKRCSFDPFALSRGLVHHTRLVETLHSITPWKCQTGKSGKLQQHNTSIHWLQAVQENIIFVSVRDMAHVYAMHVWAPPNSTTQNRADNYRS